MGRNIRLSHACVRHNWPVAGSFVYACKPCSVSAARPCTELGRGLKARDDDTCSFCALCFRQACRSETKLCSGSQPHVDPFLKFLLKLSSKFVPTGVYINFDGTSMTT